ncbi:metallopeptidase family protein [Stakelama sp. CBK3Z-3]|uniref:Metallopeptidase family protein n=1 Tax=Stakelama flava TaxID=2860338 RepID=A0ABS6XNV2_9SPHN|nr:metallopeptidase family protein [Stakelama flava]MBW4331081.1 metallopeptidase family protein [Stakelama flava]
MAAQEPCDSVPDARVIERMAQAALAQIPAPFADHLANVVLRVEELADAETLAAVGLTHPMQLSGVYHGRPIGEKSAWDVASYPDQIRLYRKPILAEWRETGVDLQRLVTHVVVHEVGHHFGLSDADMHALEDSAGEGG